MKSLQPARARQESMGGGSSKALAEEVHPRAFTLHAECMLGRRRRKEAAGKTQESTLLFENQARVSDNGHQDEERTQIFPG